MSVYEGTSEDKYSRSERKRHKRRDRCGRGWRPVELGAMVLGFIVYWPIGLSILFLKIWQKSEGYQGDLASFVQEKAGNMQNIWNDITQRAAHMAPAEWKAGFGMPSSGNKAFDDWRASEMRRLEEERQKLVAAEREFAEHLDRLRRARDRAEFDQFMSERTNRTEN